MRLFRMGVIWGVVYAITLLPFAFVFLLTGLEAMYQGSWSPFLTRYDLEGLGGSLFPFFIALFCASAVLETRDRRASPPRRPLLGVPMPVWVIAWAVGLMILVASREDEVPMSDDQKRELAASGCINYPRDAIVPLPGSFYVLVYDRRCKTAPKYTVNVSLSDASTPVGPGNAFVAEAEDGTDTGAQRLQVFARIPASRRELQILYDRHSHVLTRNSTVYGLSVSAKPDILPSAMHVPSNRQPR